MKPLTRITKVDINPGETYGNYTVLSESSKRGHNRYFLCKCNCGAEKEIALGRLRGSKYKSCIKCSWRVRGHAQVVRTMPEYKTWQSIRQRCYNPRNASHKYYADRGIIVCERWNDFINFLEDMGLRPSPMHSIERKDNDGNYEPSNCIWADAITQMRNRRICRLIEFNSRVQTCSTWAQEIGLSLGSLIKRLNTGWSIEQALTEPKRVRKPGMPNKIRRD